MNDANDRRLRFAALNALGGGAVLASYAWGLGQPAVAAALWGGVPESWRPLYTLNMALAAAGYFPFTSYWLLAVPPERVRVARRFGFAALLALYALILLPSALWLPLTAAYLDAPSPALWALIRLDLGAVAIGALGVIAALCAHEPPGSRAWRTAALVGAVPFASQTALLDALVWPAFFPR